MRNRSLASSDHVCDSIRKELRNKGGLETSRVHHSLRPQFLMQHARFATLKQCNIAQSLRLLRFKMEANQQLEGGPSGLGRQDNLEKL